MRYFFNHSKSAPGYTEKSGYILIRAVADVIKQIK